jgi:hypothetical protein
VSKQRGQVLVLLREASGPLSPQAIASILDKNPGAIRELLSQMARESQVVRLERGLYTYPEAGTQPDALTKLSSEPDHPAEVNLRPEQEPDEAESGVSARARFRQPKPKKPDTHTGTRAYSARHGGMVPWVNKREGGVYD